MASHTQKWITPRADSPHQLRCGENIMCIIKWQILRALRIYDWWVRIPPPRDLEKIYLIVFFLLRILYIKIFFCFVLILWTHVWSIFLKVFSLFCFLKSCWAKAEKTCKCRAAIPIHVKLIYYTRVKITAALLSHTHTPLHSVEGDYRRWNNDARGARSARSREGILVISLSNA